SSPHLARHSFPTRRSSDLATEAGVKDVQNLSEFIIQNNIKAIFVESSVPRRTIEALQKSVLSKNHKVQIGGSLYSDALGNPGTEDRKSTRLNSSHVKSSYA